MESEPRARPQGSEDPTFRQRAKEYKGVAALNWISKEDRQGLQRSKQGSSESRHEAVAQGTPGCSGSSRVREGICEELEDVTRPLTPRRRCRA